MQQEVLMENKEIEFILEPNKKFKCYDCEKEFRHLEKCKDGKKRCKSCKKKMITNIFYNPNWKNRNFVGINNISGQEISIQIHNLIRQGLTPNHARNRVLNDLRIVRHQKRTKVLPECPKPINLDIKIEEKNQLNNVLVEGLGMKKR